MANQKPIYATEVKRGDQMKIAVVEGTCCSRMECAEFGCNFPYCAILSGEEFTNEDEAREKYSSLEIM